MADRRRAEIEEKKAKLAELRRARDERRAILAQGGSATPAPDVPLTTSRRDVNEIVDSLLGSSSSTRPTTPYGAGPSRGASGSHTPLPASVTKGGRVTPTTQIPDTPAGRSSRLSNEGSVTDRRTGSGGLGLTPGQGGADRELMTSPMSQLIDYVDHSAELYELPTKATKPVVTYSKAVQTSTVSTSTSTDDLDDYGETEEGARKRDGGSGRETEDEMRRRILEELEDERKALEAELRDMRKKEEERTVSDMPNEQRQAIYASNEFASFIEESSKIVQRALSDGYDYTKDYTIGIDGAFDDMEGTRVKLVCAFSDERWTAGRSITDVDWSPKFHELAVASYNKNPSAVNDPDGIVAVWNLHLLERPEFVFHAPSDVLSVTFSPFHPTLIFGGSYSGQVLLWDTRAKHLPVLKTPLSAAGHTYPIYAMKMVGTQNANNLISSSTDGLVCSWLADMLAQPQEALSLTVPSHNKTDEVSVTCLDFPDNETATFWVGTEEGSVYQAHRYDRASAKAGLNSAPDDIYRGHAGPVTGIDVHPASGSMDFSDLFLTSSVDWTVKLWRAKHTTAATKTADKNTASAGIAPLHSFEESDDYVFDVKWHPSHPAIFGTVDGSGKFDLWNLNRDVEVPVVSTQVGDRAINKLAWDRTPLSRKAALGSSDGKLYVYDVAEKLVFARDNEWAELQKTVQGLVAARDAGGGLSVEVPPPPSSRYGVR